MSQSAICADMFGYADKSRLTGQNSNKQEYEEYL